MMCDVYDYVREGGTTERERGATRPRSQNENERHPPFRAEKTKLAGSRERNRENPPTLLFSRWGPQRSSAAAVPRATPPSPLRAALLSAHVPHAFYSSSPPPSSAPIPC
eukprot:scaffold137814_cov27-Tisochrysis_lutea.AAC.3